MPKCHKCSPKSESWKSAISALLKIIWPFFLLPFQWLHFFIQLFCELEWIHLCKCHLLPNDKHQNSSITLIIGQVAMLEARVERVGECAENKEKEDRRAKFSRDHGVARRARISAHPQCGTRWGLGTQLLDSGQKYGKKTWQIIRGRCTRRFLSSRRASVELTGGEFARKQVLVNWVAVGQVRK